MSLKRGEQRTGDMFYTIGVVYNPNTLRDEYFQTGWASDHLTGRLTNEKLMEMTDEQLRKIAMSPDGSTVYTETFKGPEDAVWCKKNDSIPGKVYDGPHRAIAILGYRAALKRKG